MNDAEMVAKALYVAREAAKDILRSHGVVVPFALTLDESGGGPLTFAPSDALPRAGWQQLVDSAEAHLRGEARKPGIGALALVCWLESGSDRAFGIQAETRSTAVFMLYPCKKRLFWWTTAEGRPADNLLVPRLFGEAPR